jgi:transposase InsO family protein
MTGVLPIPIPPPFGSSIQIELLNRKRWKTRVELANAIFEYIEVFHNRQRRHSALGYRDSFAVHQRSRWW